MPSEKAQMISPAQGAALLGVGLTSVQRWIDAGLIRALRTGGGHRRMRRADLAAFAKSSGFHLHDHEPREPRRVLIVDDDADMVLVMADRIRALRADIEALTCTTPFLVGLMVVRKRPDLLILDIRMPGMSGIEVCEAIKETPELSSCVVVGLTGVRNATQIAAMRAAGAREVYMKPLSTEMLHELLESRFPSRAIAGARK